MKQKYLLESLEFILNKGFCTRTIHRAWMEFNKIKQYLAEEDRKLIYKWMLELDPDYPDYRPNDDYAREQFAFSVKQAMQHI
jgi:hypothetical protein